MLDNADSAVIPGLAQGLANKYTNHGFAIINQTQQKLAYILTKHVDAKVKMPPELIKEINTATSGRGGGKDTYCQGSCLNTTINLDKIKEIIAKL